MAPCPKQAFRLKSAKAAKKETNAEASLSYVTPGGEYKIAGQPKPGRANAKSARAGAGSAYAQEDSGYLRDDQSRRGGFFRRLFGSSR
jgi:hypothetical protein